MGLILKISHTWALLANLIKVPSVKNLLCWKIHERCSICIKWWALLRHSLYIIGLMSGLSGTCSQNLPHVWAVQDHLIKVPSDNNVLCWKMNTSTWAATWQNQQNECAPSEDSDQPGHPPSLISVFAVRMKKAWILSYPLSAQRRLWSDWADAQADLSLRWAHTHFVGFVMMQLICIKCLAFFRQPLRSYCCHPCYILVNFLKFRCANGSLSFLRCMLSGWFVFDVAKL